jgi:nicotinate-nucleotide adenylyltransferase
MTHRAQAALFGGQLRSASSRPPGARQAALAQLALDRVVWMPAARSPHKSDRAPPSGARPRRDARPADRGRAALRGRRPRTARAGPSFTVDTLRELRAEQPDTAWWLVIGQDQYARFDTWHAWREIVALAGLAVAARNGLAVRPAPGLAGCPHALRVLALPELPHSATAARAGSACRTGHLCAGRHPGRALY